MRQSLVLTLSQSNRMSTRLRNETCGDMGQAGSWLEAAGAQQQWQQQQPQQLLLLLLLLLLLHAARLLRCQRSGPSSVTPGLELSVPPALWPSGSPPPPASPPPPSRPHLLGDVNRFIKQVR
jgi:hypothetical protein